MLNSNKKEIKTQHDAECKGCGGVMCDKKEECNCNENSICKHRWVESKEEVRISVCKCSCKMCTTLDEERSKLIGIDVFPYHCNECKGAESKEITDWEEMRKNEPKELTDLREKWKYSPNGHAQEFIDDIFDSISTLFQAQKARYIKRIEELRHICTCYTTGEKHSQMCKSEHPRFHKQTNVLLNRIINSLNEEI